MDNRISLFQLVSLQCLKAIITPEIGLRYFCDENHRLLLAGLRSACPLVKMQILEVMSGLSMYSYFEYYTYSFHTSSPASPNAQQRNNSRNFIAKLSSVNEFFVQKRLFHGNPNEINCSCLQIHSRFVSTISLFSRELFGDKKMTDRPR